MKNNTENADRLLDAKTPESLKDPLQQNQELISAATKKELLSELATIHSTQEQVKLFGKVMDDYGVDALVGLLPVYGDVASSVLATLYLLYQGKKIGLPLIDILKILGYQTADAVIGLVPYVGDIADYFFKANKWSAKLFQKHSETLQKRAIAQGVSKEDIQQLQENNAKFMQAMNTMYDKEFAVAA